jgi:hypothetical protein
LFEIKNSLILKFTQKRYIWKKYKFEIIWKLGWQDIFLWLLVKKVYIALIEKQN